MTFSARDAGKPFGEIATHDFSEIAWDEQRDKSLGQPRRPGELHAHGSSVI
jgi:hypothetical protein